MDLALGLAIAVIGSIISTAVYLLIVWRLDRYEKEPRRLLGVAFLWGALPALILALILEVMYSTGGSLDEIVVAPVVEELAKGLGLLALLVFAYREVDGVLDGIVYGAMIGFGFAFSENILYVVGSVAEDGLAVGILVLFLRTIIFGANHALFSSLTGAAVGAARMSPGQTRRLILLVIGVTLAVMFHGVHNLGAAMAGDTGLVSIGLSFVSNWMGILGMLVVVALAWRREERWMADELAAEVPLGLLTPEEYAAITSSAGRQRSLARTMRRGGWSAYRRQGRLYALLTELAFKKHQTRVMQKEQDTAADIDRLRQAIQSERAAGVAARM